MDETELSLFFLMFLAFSGIWWRWRMGSEHCKAKWFCHTAFCLIATPRQIQRIGDDDDDADKLR